jgi:hypothetical protein
VEDRRLIGEYASWDSDRVNNSLIIDPEQDAPLNSIIANLEPLEKDILVYRYIRKYEIQGTDQKSSFYLPPASGEYIYYSYLSTSFLASFVVHNSCLRDVVGIMVISVPRGSRCMYIPGLISRQEYEIVFPHKTVLEIQGKASRDFVCSEEARSFLVYDARLVG